MNVHRQLVKFRKHSHVSWKRNQYRIQTCRTPPILNFITLHQLLIFDNRWWACLWSFKCGRTPHWSFVQVYCKYARVVQQSSNSQSAFIYLAGTGEMKFDPFKKTQLCPLEPQTAYVYTHKHKQHVLPFINVSASTFFRYRRFTWQISHLKTKLYNHAQSYNTLCIYAYMRWKHFSIQYSPTSENSIAFYKVPSLRPFVLLVRATWRWMWVWASEEWHWHGKTEVLGENSVSVPLCPTQISQGLAWYWTLASALRGRWLTTWATTRSWIYCQLLTQSALRKHHKIQSVKATNGTSISFW